jgi:Ring hydroxylating alpha subunit (catalytic domain)
VHPELCEVVPAFKRVGGADLDWDRGIPHREGATTFTFTGTTDRAPFPGLSEDERTRHKGELIYPNLMLSMSPDLVTVFTLWPKGPDRTVIDCDFLFHPEEMARPGFDPSDAVEFWDLVNRQDWRICESVQQGMSSRVFRFGSTRPWRTCRSTSAGTLASGWATGPDSRSPLCQGIFSWPSAGPGSRRGAPGSSKRRCRRAPGVRPRTW